MIIKLNEAEYIKLSLAIKKVLSESEAKFSEDIILKGILNRLEKAKINASEDPVLLTRRVRKDR